MKNASTLACFLLLTTAIFAQKNTLKAHFGLLPTNTTVFSMGIGYERMVAKTWSAQCMFNLFGWSEAARDGHSEVTKNAILEARRYFRIKSKEPLDKSFFMGCYLEAFRKNVLPGGETEEPPPPVIGKRWGMGTGVVFGMRLPLLKILSLEFFAGPKLRYVWSENYSGVANHYHTYNHHSYFKLAPRLGCNIGYRF